MPLAIALVAGFLGVSGAAFAGTADDYDLLIRANRARAAPGETVIADAGIAVRAAGVQGWSYGVRHDPVILSIETATTDGTDTPGALVDPAFEVTTITTARDGYITGVVLSFSAPAELPLADFFNTSRSTYTVVDGADLGSTTSIEFTGELAAPSPLPDPPLVDINVSVLGIAIVPDAIESATIEIATVSDLAFTIDAIACEGAPCELRADLESTVDLAIGLENRAASGSTDVQAWSYGVALDRDLVEPVAAVPGADAAAVHDGAGPDLTIYNLDESNEDGSVRGVTVGVIIDLDDPAGSVIGVAAGESVHLDTITLRSVVSLDEPDDSRELDVSLADDVLGGNVTIQALVIVDTFEVFPDASASQPIRLVGPPVVAEPLFIRGDANSDSHVDIADGVWIVHLLFWDGEATACRGAADANSDGAIDISDALYVINWRLQPGAAPGSLFSAPGAPFPDCGTSVDVTLEDCPVGSHVCSQ